MRNAISCCSSSTERDECQQSKQLQCNFQEQSKRTVARDGIVETVDSTSILLLPETFRSVVSASQNMNINRNMNMKILSTSPVNNLSSSSVATTISKGSNNSNLEQQQKESIPTTNENSNNNNSNNNVQVLSSLVAGVGSGALASIACAPLDLIRTRMQVMGDLAVKNGKTTPNFSIYRALKDVLAADGIQGCFRGLGATLATVPAFWGIYFPIYEMAKKDLYAMYLQQQQSLPIPTQTLFGTTTAEESSSGQQPNEYPSRVPHMVHMTSAIFAGAVADFFCNPMFVVRTRMQTEALHYLEMPVEERKPHGMLRTVKNLYVEGGVPIFWRGLTASLLGLSHVAIQFPVYEWFKAEARSRSPNNEESPIDLFFASGMSKMCATTLTYPHEVLRSRMMDYRVIAQPQTTGTTSAAAAASSGHGLVSTFRRVVVNEGYGALYTGIHVSLVRVVPNCCITFMSYELILRWAKQNMDGQ